MSVLALARRLMARQNPASRPLDLATSVACPAPEYFDVDVAERAEVSLTEQLREVVDRNADGVNQMALSIRRQSDLLLTLGISDPMAAKAGSLAQRAIELSNTGRGRNLQALKHNVSVTERTQYVSQAIAFVSRAEMLLSEAKRQNRANIDTVLERQDHALNALRLNLQTPAE